MFCSNCGTKLHGGKYCSNCGLKAGTALPRSSDPSANYSSPLRHQVETDEDSGTGVSPWQIVGVIIFVVIVAFIFWLNSRSSDVSSKSSGFTVDDCYKIMVDSGAPEIVGTQVMCKMEFDKGQANFDEYMRTFIDAKTTFEDQLREVTGQ